MGLFDEIPIRLNGSQDVDAAWWNTIRSRLIDAFGTQITAQTQVTILDNQSSFQDVTGLVFDKAEVVYALVRYTIQRTDGSSPRRECGTLELSLSDDESDWELSRVAVRGDALSMGADSLSVTSAGQIQYKSDSMGGTYSGSLNFKVLDTLNKEA